MQSAMHPYNLLLPAIRSPKIDLSSYSTRRPAISHFLVHQPIHPFRSNPKIKVSLFEIDPVIKQSTHPSILRLSIHHKTIHPSSDSSFISFLCVNQAIICLTNQLSISLIHHVFRLSSHLIT